MDAPRAETSLGDLEPAPFAQKHIRRRHAHVVEHDLGVPVWRIVVTEDRQHAHHGDAGRIERHQNHRLLLVPRRHGSLFPMTIAIRQRGSPAPEMNHLRPLTM